MTIRELFAVFSAFGLLQYPLDAYAQSAEEITVQRLVVDAHVVDDHGNAMSDLRPSDFIVQIDGRPASVDAVEWIPASSAARDSDTRASEDTDDFESEIVPRGRIIVLFFQTDFQRIRVGGQMKMIPYAETMVDRLLPTDLVAVVSHDSHLKLRQDFTSDHARIKRAIRESLRIDNPFFESADGPIALAGRIDPQQARDAATPERAMQLIGEALEPIEGAKSVILFGWGMGIYTSFGVIADPHYGAARQALDEARATVFSLDISDADYHSLEAGLRQTAADTGGMYLKTNAFARMAVERVEKAISGRYELVIKTNVNRGLHKVDIRLAHRSGTVLARSTYETH